MVENSLNGRRLEASIEGKIVGFDMSFETLSHLRRVLTELHVAFLIADHALEERHYDRVFPRRKQTSE